RSGPAWRPGSTGPRCGWPSSSARPTRRPGRPRPRPPRRRTRWRGRPRRPPRAPAAQADSLQRSLQAATAAQRSQAELALELARNQQERLTLRSPLAGNVQLGRSGGGGATLPRVQGLPEGAEQALQGLGGGTQAGQTGPPLRVGSEVSAGQTVATVYDVSDLLVAAEVDETDIALVHPGQWARGELDAFPQATFPAKVRRGAVAPTAGQSAAGGVTYQVDLVLGEAAAGS